MTGRIVTARHGRPDLSRKQKMNAREYGGWWGKYDESGLHPAEAPPASLLDIARNSTTVLSSTLPRAIETAMQVTGANRDAIVKNALFVEAPLPPPPIPLIRLKPGHWGVISRTFWCLGYAPGQIETHQQTWARVRQIVEYLVDASGEGDVLLCAHGYLNWMIDRQIRKRSDYTRVAREGGNRYWSWRAYVPVRTGTLDMLPPEERKLDYHGSA